MAALAKSNIHREPTRTGELVLLVSGPEGPAKAGPARVRSRVEPPARGRFLVALSATGAFRGELRKELPKPLGKNRILLDTAPRREGSSGEVDVERLAERAWFYRRLGATHLVVEAEPPRGADLKAYLVHLLAAFAPLAGDEELAVDVILPARTAPLLSNTWMLSYLVQEAAQKAGREFAAGLIRTEHGHEGAFTLDAAQPTEDAPPPLEGPPPAPARPVHGQLGLL